MGRQSEEDAHLCMKRRVVLDETVIEVFDEEMITAIKLLSSKHYGCLLDRANESQFTLIKMPFSQEGLTVDGRRLMYEITFSLNPPNIAIRAHGQSVSLEDLSLSFPLTLSTIDAVIHLLDSFSLLCLGSVIIPEDCSKDF